jgi:hypothetical protein
MTAMEGVVGHVFRVRNFFFFFLTVEISAVVTPTAGG